MKKKIVIGMCIVATMLTACGNSASGESTETTEVASTVISTDDYDFHDYVTLGQYSGFEISVPVVSVTDEDVEEALSNLQTSNVTYEATDATTVPEGAYVNVNYSMTDEDGDDLSSYDAEGVEIHLGTGSYFTELEDAMVGMTVGTTNSVDVNVTDDYYDTTIAGKTVTYSVTINSVDESVTPEATDEWIASISEYSTLDEWKEGTKALLEEEQQGEQDSVFKTGVQNYVMSNTTFEELPQELVSSMVENYRAEDEKMAESLGYDFNDFITTYYGYDDEEAYTTDLEEYVEQSVKMDFVLRALREAEEISMSEDDLEAFVQQCTESYGFESSDKLIEYYGEDVVEAACLNNLTWDAICALSTRVEDENYYSEDGDYTYTEEVTETTEEE